MLIRIVLLFISLFYFKYSEGQITIPLKKTNSGVLMINCKLNGLPMDFIFDTGASSVCISLNEVERLFNKGLIDKSDLYGIDYFRDATGKISAGFKFNIKVLEIDKIILKNVEAIIVDNDKAPLLLGMSALTELGDTKLNFKSGELTIMNDNLVKRSYTLDCFKNVLLNQNKYYLELAGFKLFQYENCIVNTMGKPLASSEYNENITDYSYKIDKNGYDYGIRFGVQKISGSVPKSIIGIELSGLDSPYEIKGVGLGSNLSTAINGFGTNYKVSETSSREKTYDWLNSNISIDIYDNKILNIRISHIPDIQIEESDVNSRILNFEVFKNAIQTFTTTEIYELFSPAFEINTEYYDHLNFSHSYSAEKINNTKLIKFINDKTYGLKSLINSKNIKGKIVMRVYDNFEYAWVLKLENSIGIKEIIFKEYYDRMLIWEIF